MKSVVFRSHPLAFALIVSLGLASPGFAAEPAAGKPVPVRIAAQRDAQISLHGRIGAAAAGTQRATVIRTPDAAFIKVHFDHFSLPDGVTLEVASPDGSEVYRYSADHRDAHTVDETLGQNGVNSFSAMSIGGPVAVLRLVGSANEPWTARHGVVVSRYLEGYPEEMLPELQDSGLLTPSTDVGTTSICGSDDKRPVACYVSSDPDAYDRSRPVGRMLSSSGSLCTVWRVGPDNRLFTNNHCISTSSGVSGAEFWFNYQQASCSGSTGAPVTKVTGSQMLKTDAALDYTLFTVNNFATLEPFGYLGLDIDPVSVGDGMYIAQHPGGRMKELGVMDGSAACAVKSTTADGTSGDPGSDIGYTCDTEGGSSGSPVISRDSHKVIALHHLGGCNNEGAKISRIWPQVATYFNNQVPDGDDGGTTPPPPDDELTPGVPVTGLAASTGNDITYTMEVPAGASNLAFDISGGTGDADLYVRFGSAPTDGSYDCRPYLNGNIETCSFASPQAGTWHVRIKAYSSFSGVSLVGDYGTGGGGTQTYSNTSDYTISDNATVESPITVSGRSGNAPGNASVDVDIRHTYKGDLRVDVVAPDGSVYNLHNRSGGSTDNVIGTYTLDLSSEPLNGTWKLRVNDNANQDTGYINSWSLTF
ncbi:proprotein convertase P-domain-containing protein [Marilutibacter chinensis]|uniref:Proprotein convertase P-domain-containing protein n=1 Tax=Marilutibacter chinensis TaxID=2912247 RepID=A0ABS9HYB8_9GAMM|nr:proprotein convertase P-domain-containing protein [Lysobacter chinensis]MCF7221797.1 proprotein convertase P-domain-containing protein [Lysobacter chinensis]MCF7223733.1 proprotein convertase P-domain-containing protein [Lysobacter chinensis]